MTYIDPTPDLFRIEVKAREPEFDAPPEDQARCGRQLEAVRTLMLDGQWRTLAQISEATGASEAGASARLRDLRKERFGSYTVERRRVGDGGLHEYRVASCPQSPESL